jgi:predicted ribosomally synthesized peptide with nif11-like leader
MAEDDALAAALGTATTPAEFVAVANDRGFAIVVEDLPPSEEAAADELSDAELAGMSGGYTFPRTDWIYCDNPWTNYWCTLRC